MAEEGRGDTTCSNMLRPTSGIAMTMKHLLPMMVDRARPLTNLMRGRPVLATFQVTLRCNSACGYCDLPLNQGRYELTREEVRGIFGQLYQEGIRFVLVQGGEPLLRTDLVDILSDLCSLGLRPTVITNGTKLTADLVARFASLRLPLSISLDTLDRTRYRLIRGADQLPQVLAHPLELHEERTARTDRQAEGGEIRLRQVRQDLEGDLLLLEARGVLAEPCAAKPVTDARHPTLVQESDARTQVSPTGVSHGPDGPHPRASPMCLTHGPHPP